MGKPDKSPADAGSVEGGVRLVAIPAWSFLERLVSALGLGLLVATGLLLFLGVATGFSARMHYPFWLLRQVLPALVATYLFRRGWKCEYVADPSRGWLEVVWSFYSLSWRRRVCRLEELHGTTLTAARWSRGRGFGWWYVPVLVTEDGRTLRTDHGTWDRVEAYSRAQRVAWSLGVSFRDPGKRRKE